MGRGARYLAVAPTADMSRDMIVPAYQEFFDDTEYGGHYEKQASIMHLRGGALIYFRSAEEPLRIEGHHVRGATLDEPSQMKPAIWPVVQSRTGYYKAPVLFTGYPTDMGWYYHDIYKAWERGDLDYLVIQFASTENPDYPRDEFERARRTMPAWLFEMRYLGKFAKPFGLVYPTFAGDSVFVEPFDIPAGWPVFVGLDPSVFFGALLIAWHEGVYYAFSEYYTEILAPAKVHAAGIAALLPQGCPVEFIYDPARLTDANELAECGLTPMYRARNDVLPGIAKLTELINEGRFKVMRGRTRNFVDQMGKYSFPTDPLTGDVAKENPIKKFDHLPDCARYVALTLEGAQPDHHTEMVVYEEQYEITKY